KHVEMDINKKTEQSEVRDYEEVDQVSEVQNEKKYGPLVKREKEVFQEQQINEQGIQEIKKKYKVLEEESEKTDGGLVLAKSLEAIISSLISDIKTKLYKKIQKANRAQECSNHF
ncbi:1726_t:CDS:2, partial [Gigaspora margarita]